MPMLIQTIDQIMHERRVNKYFLRLNKLTTRGDEFPKARHDHLKWFKTHGLTFETAAPRGWLEGDPGCYAVYFDGPDDQRLADYSLWFEAKDGRSLKPDTDQMSLLTYESWLNNGGEQYLSRTREEDL